ncbi:MAG: 3'-5' exonuclease [Bacteroidales bacterium]|nr:3'-5' exonuclease [Bacteroidales bacterium]
MLNQAKLSHILFLDIETVPQHESYNQLTNRWKALWDKKHLQFREESKGPEETYNRAGIYAEFGRIICISACMFTADKENRSLKVKSWFNNNEKSILEDFSEALNKLQTKKKALYLCAHNGKEFDFPFIARRMLVNGIKLPACLSQAGKKPWEVPHFDTMELWKFGDYKHYTSLELLSCLFDLPTPKQNIDGSMVYHTYYKEQDLPKIVKYCEDDAVAVARIFLKYRQEAELQDNEIIS